MAFLKSSRENSTRFSENKFKLLLFATIYSDIQLLCSSYAKYLIKFLPVKCDLIKTLQFYNTGIANSVTTILVSSLKFKRARPKKFRARFTE